MNYLVILDAHAGELEKILSGIKTMILKVHDPAGSSGPTVCPGDSLFFLRSDERLLRVKATATRVLYCANNSNEELTHTLKEMQPRLQLTEDQYNHWFAKEHVLLVEFESAHKIEVIPVALKQNPDQTNWIAFEKFSLIQE